MERRVDVAVVGAGIVGLATARAVQQRRPDLRLTVLEKEVGVGRHQTGHNSGVIHSGILYRPGSVKAGLTVRGRAQLLDFCRAHSIPTLPVGKVFVARDRAEEETLRRLQEYARENGVPGVERLDPAGLERVAPGVRGTAGIWVPSAAIVDYHRVAERLALSVTEAGGEVRTGAEVRAARRTERGWELETSNGPVRALCVVNCAGLGSDLLAERMGARSPVRILPFRGDFYELFGPMRERIRTLVYPPPDPRVPFLGIHLTPTVDGQLWAGPNAVLALDREGYAPSAFNPAEMVRLAEFGGAWGLLRRYGAYASREWVKSTSPAQFLESIRTLYPEARRRDLGPRHSGVRAQAVRPDGTLEDDFVLVGGPQALHVVNAPSPAATASFAIADTVVDRLLLPGGPLASAT